ncbi:hypothetical protein SKAU_G00165340 [Synaphobranchus kaupii]|uniref:Uncharacterized protein n=1 Tax=Synaphobranchus kaupii TaxID=118154 RepID=A0A9Q1FJS9_SYNKA|nr:hypothetical protein SKAU_G00165340 [Synaphobranchus kaupii]
MAVRGRGGERSVGAEIRLLTHLGNNSRWRWRRTTVSVVLGGRMGGSLLMAKLFFVGRELGFPRELRPTPAFVSPRRLDEGHQLFHWRLKMAIPPLTAFSRDPSLGAQPLAPTSRLNLIPFPGMGTS